MKRIISAILVLAMIACMAPAFSVFAADDTTITLDGKLDDWAGLDTITTTLDTGAKYTYYGVVTEAGLYCALDAYTTGFDAKADGNWWDSPNFECFVGPYTGRENQVSISLTDKEGGWRYGETNVKFSGTAASFEEIEGNAPYHFIVEFFIDKADLKSEWFYADGSIRVGMAADTNNSASGAYVTPTGTHQENNRAVVTSTGLYTAQEYGGITATYYTMNLADYVGTIGEDNRSARCSYEGNKKFDASAETLLNGSVVLSTEENVTSVNPGDKDWYIFKWEGTMTAAEAGDYTLIGRKIDNGFVMFVNDVKVYEYWGASHWFDGANDRLVSDLGSFHMDADTPANVEIYFLELDGGDGLNIYATTTPDDTNSGANINDVFTFDLTKTTYTGNKDWASNTIVGRGTAANGAQCEEANYKFESSLFNLLDVLTEGETKTFSTFFETPINQDGYVVKYTGWMVPKTSGAYTFGTFKVDNGFAMFVNDQKVYEMWAGNTWNDNSETKYTSSIDLEAGKAYRFEAWFLETNGGQVIRPNCSIDDGAAVNLYQAFTYSTRNPEIETSLAGDYYVADYSGTVNYLLNFDNGTMTVVDKADDGVDISGTYEYCGTFDDYITVYDMDGNETEITISVDWGGNPTFAPNWMSWGDPLIAGQPPVAPVLLLGDNAVTVKVADYFANPVVATFTATEAGTYTIDAAEGEENAIVAIEIPYGSEDVELPYEFELAADETIKFIITTGANVMQNGGSFEDEINVVIAVAGDDEGGETIEGVIEVETTDTYGFIDQYTFTAEKAGTYTFTVPAGLGFYSKTSYDAWGPAEVDFYDNESGATVTVDLEAGEEYIFYVGALTKDSWTITYTAVVGEGGGDVGGGDVGGGDDDSSVKDANGLGGEYTFNFVMDYTIIFTPDSEGATTGTLTVVDPINTKYSKTYDYEIVDGMYVLYLDGEATSEAIISQDPANWTFQNMGMAMPKPFAPVETSSEDGDGDTAIVVGDNTVSVKDEDLLAGSIEKEFNVIETGNYSFNGDFFVQVTDADGNAVERNDDYTYTLEAGNTYTLNLGTSFLGGMSGNYGLNVEFTVAEDEPVEIEPSLNGTYQAGFAGIQDDMYVLTFDPTTGTLVIEDNAGGRVNISGTYTYEGTLVNGITVYNENGEVVYDFMIGLGMDGNPAFQGPALMMPQPLVPVDGDDEGGEEGGDDFDGNIVLGENSIVVNNAFFGVEATFTATEAGTYVITLADGETNAYIKEIFENGDSWIEEFPYQITLEAGETLKLWISTDNYEADTIDFSITMAEPEGGEGGEEGGEGGEGGDNAGTGDMAALFVVLAVVSLGVAVVAVKRRQTAK